MNTHAALWKWLLQAEWQASALVVLIFLASRLLGPRLSAGWRFALWQIVVLRLLLPMVPVNPGGIYHYVPSTPAQAWEQISIQAPVPILLSPDTVPVTTSVTNFSSAPAVVPVFSTSSKPSVIKWPSPKDAAFWIWVIVAAAGLLRLAFGHAWFCRGLRHRSRAASPGLQTLLEECKKTTGIRKNISLLITDTVHTPAMMGLFRPRLLLPAAVAASHSRERLRLIFLHELAHLRRLDQWTNLLALVAGVIHWFNPLVWLGLRRMRADREMAVDAMVLSRHGHGEEMREAYSETLLSLLTTAGGASRTQPMLGILENRAELKKRLQAIGRFRTGARAWSFLGAGLLLSMALVGFGGNQEKKDAPAPPMDIRTQKNLSPQFFVAIDRGDLAAVKNFVAQGMDVNIPNNGAVAVSIYPPLPLLDAIAHGRVDIVRFLVSKGARVDGRSVGGATAVTAALMGGQRQIADILISAGAEYDRTLYIVSAGNLEELKALDAKTPLPDAKLHEALWEAAVLDQGAIFDWLLGKVSFASDKARREELKDIYVRIVGSTHGQASMLTRLEALGVDPAPFGGGAMNYAIMRDRPDIVRHLLEKGVSPDALATADKEPLSCVGPQSPLEFAATFGHLEIARLLVDHGASLNKLPGQKTGYMVGQYGPLGDALCYSYGGTGQGEIAELLLKNGADPKIKDDDGHNAAWLAASSGRANSPDLLETMITQGVDVKGVDIYRMTILQYMLGFGALPQNDDEALFAGQIRKIKTLVRAGVDFNAGALMQAIKNGQSAAAETLIGMGASVSGTDSDGNTTLALCMGRGIWWEPKPLHTELIATLLERGVDPNTAYTFPPSGAFLPPGKDAKPKSLPLLKEAFTMANEKGDAKYRDDARKAVILLLDHGAKFSAPVDEKTERLLKAAAMGDLRAIKEAVNGGARVGAADGDGWNALTISLALEYDDCTEWLVKNGASGATATKEGYSPLYFAVFNDNENLARRFLKDGANPNLQSFQLPILSMFIEAVRHHNLPIVKLLVENGAKGNAWDIASCIDEGQVESARLLLESGVKPDDDDHYFLPSNMNKAVGANEPAILQMLLDHGASPELPEQHTGHDLQALLTNAKQAGEGGMEMVSILEAAIKKRDASNIQPVTGSGTTP